MARILYAVNGDGYGHATRAHSVGAALLARGHEVRFLTSLKSQAYLGAVFPGLVHEAFGLCISYNQGRAQNCRTIIENLRRGLSQWNRITNSIRRVFRDFRPQLVVTDFEPFTAFYARRLDIPFVSVDNQHLLTHCHVDRPPGFSRDVLNAYLTIRLLYGGARRYLIPTFIRASVRYHPTTIVDPILRPKVYEKSIEHGDFLLAYKGAGGENDAMRQTLEGYERMPIRAYGFEATGQHGQVTYKPTTPDGFLHDLAGCAGVIMSAGHSLACECLHLEKPMLLIPIAQQYEQAVNAYHVEKLGAGRWVDRLSPAAMDEFVDQLDTYRSAMVKVPKASLDPVVEAIEREIP